MQHTFSIKSYLVHSKIGWCLSLMPFDLMQNIFSMFSKHSLFNLGIFKLMLDDSKMHQLQCVHLEMTTCNSKINVFSHHQTLVRSTRVSFFVTIPYLFYQTPRGIDIFQKGVFIQSQIGPTWSDHGFNDKQRRQLTKTCNSRWRLGSFRCIHVL